MGRKFRFTSVEMSNDNKTQLHISSQFKRVQMIPTGDGSPPGCYTSMWGPHPLRMHKVTPAGDGSLPICSIARRNSRPLRKLVPHQGPHCFSSGRPMANMERCLRLLDREGANTPLKF